MSPSLHAAPRRESRASSLGRKLAALAGAGGSLVAGTEAEAVTYTPTAGVVAAQGIPGFSFVDASTVTLGNLRGPATAGSTAWDLDGVGGTNFSLINSVSTSGSRTNGKLEGLNVNSFLMDGNLFLRNIATPGPVGGAQTQWRTGDFTLTASSNPAVNGVNFTKDVSGQFGFRFDAGSDPSFTYYGWASIVIDGQAAGSGFKITEAYYQSTPGTAINVGAVPVPEPTGMALLALGSAGVMAWRSRRKQAN